MTETLGGWAFFLGLSPFGYCPLYRQYSYTSSIVGGGGCLNNNNYFLYHPQHHQHPVCHTNSYLVRMIAPTVSSSSPPLHPTMRTVSYHCTVSTHVEECIVRIVAYLSGIHDVASTSSSSSTSSMTLDHRIDGSSGSSSIVRSVTNPNRWTATSTTTTTTTTTTSGIGLMGILRMVAVPELLCGGSTAVDHAVMESWIYTIQQSIVPILQMVSSPNDNTLHEQVQQLSIGK
jgi:hypothetical protein